MLFACLIIALITLLLLLLKVYDINIIIIIIIVAFLKRLDSLIVISSGMEEVKLLVVDTMIHN